METVVWSVHVWIMEAKHPLLGAYCSLEENCNPRIEGSLDCAITYSLLILSETVIHLLDTGSTGYCTVHAVSHSTPYYSVSTVKSET